MKPVLYAEDDDNDVYLMARTFEDLGIKHPLKIATDGKKAIAYLTSTEPSPGIAANPTPCLVLLDLSMPGRKGIEVLQWIRQQPKLAELPVVVLTSSNQQTDIHQAYRLGANGFFVKPGDPDELQQIVRTLQESWLDERPRGGKFHDLSAYRSPEQGVSAPPKS